MKQEEKAKPTRGRPSRRPEIIAATEALIRTRGLASTTTRAIAEQAGCSEAALYVHFDNRLTLLLAVLEESLPDMLLPLKSLEQSIGTRTPEQNLTRALRAIFAFHERVVPMLCGLFADPQLLSAYRDSLTTRNKGPQGAIARLQRYISAEQSLGRTDKSIDAETSATLLMASSFFKAFVSKFFGAPTPSAAAFKKIVAAAIASESK
ncbi:MAG TPA: TetR/AcrR family transcriptional regulator [Edaphobacter sp.]|jgi:AcrR family transcriptional regulator|nr:TetR/AcrR family transcriptional regulator [Edaphobacter sp.]